MNGVNFFKDEELNNKFKCLEGQEEEKVNIEEYSFEISKAVSTGEYGWFCNNDLRNRIKTINASKDLKISLPPTYCENLISMLAAIPRIICIAICTLGLLPIFGIASIFWKSDYLDPTEITNDLTPVLLIHGSSANQRQWDIFRLVLKYFNFNIGHVFSLNLNESALSNDKKSLADYAEKVREKVDKMKVLYEQAGYNLDRFIPVGHSMGGLVSGQYALLEDSSIDVKARTMFAISSPWYGSPLADYLYKEEEKPNGAFRTTSQSTKDLRDRIIKKANSGNLNIYTFSSSFDWIVRPSSSSLPINPKNNFYSESDDHYSSAANFGLINTIGKKIEENTSKLEKNVNIAEKTKQKDLIAV